MESAHPGLIRVTASYGPQTPAGSQGCRCYLLCHHLNFIHATRCNYRHYQLCRFEPTIHRFVFQLDGAVKEERRRLRRVVLDSPIQRSTLSGRGRRDPAPAPGEGGVKPCGLGAAPLLSTGCAAPFMPQPPDKLSFCSTRPRQCGHSCWQPRPQ